MANIRRDTNADVYSMKRLREIATTKGMQAIADTSLPIALPIS